MKFEGYTSNEVKVFLEELPPEKWSQACDLLMIDSRSAVRKLGETLKKRIQKRELERVRLETMVRNEQEIAHGIRLVCGVDEAGRGPLAGPVVAGAVILPEGFLPEGLNDSKKVSESRRESLYSEITENALAWSVGISDPKRIDEINILEATREAMLQAVTQLKVKPNYVLLDAVEIKALEIPHKGIIKGDEKCLSIAAASIIAKVTRDRLMVELGIKFPQYGFAIHKGYGTSMHYEALRNCGLTEHHRKSFLKGWLE